MEKDYSKFKLPDHSHEDYCSRIVPKLQKHLSAPLKPLSQTQNIESFKVNRLEINLQPLPLSLKMYSQPIESKKRRTNSVLESKWSPASTYLNPEKSERFNYTLKSMR